MPLYEYQCDGCRHRFEAIQKFSDPPLASCPKCGAALRKLQSAPAFQFKGDGWYITDYAKKDGEKKKEGEKTDAGAAGKTDGTSGASSDSKPAESKSDGQAGTSSSSSSPASASTPSPPGATKASN